MNNQEHFLDNPITPAPVKAWPIIFLEALAVAFGAAYTILITYGYIWCWPAAIVSSGIFVYLCYSKRIYAETALHLFYVAIAIYGWATWGSSSSVGYKNLPWYSHAACIAGGMVACGVLAWLLKKYTNAFWPGVDTFTTVFSIMATFMMVWSVADNWYYWIVIDAISVALYAGRRMYLTAALFVVYTILAVNGAMVWN